MRVLWGSRRGIAAVLVFAVLTALVALAASEDGEDRPGTVEVIDSGATPASASASVSGASAAAPGAEASATGALGAYQPVSDVSTHALVVLDVCAINSLLPSDTPIDFEAIEKVYVEGVNSVNSDGSVRTIAGFART